jgi:hypothetical protein
MYIFILRIIAREGAEGECQAGRGGGEGAGAYMLFGCGFV